MVLTLEAILQRLLYCDVVRRMDPLSSNVARGPVSATASLHPSCMAWRLLMSGNYRDPYLWTELHPCKIPQNPWFSVQFLTNLVPLVKSRLWRSLHRSMSFLLICMVLGFYLVYRILLAPSFCSHLGLPGVRFLTGQSGFLAICPVKNMMLNRTISCPVFGQPW